MSKPRTKKSTRRSHKVFVEAARAEAEEEGALGIGQEVESAGEEDSGEEQRDQTDAVADTIAPEGSREDTSLVSSKDFGLGGETLRKLDLDTGLQVEDDTDYIG